MIPVLDISSPADAARIESILGQLSLSPVDLALNLGERGQMLSAVNAILSDVAERGDEAIVESARKFDDPTFTIDQIRATPQQLQAAHQRTPPDQLAAIRRSIAQVREYQQHILPTDPPTLHRNGLQLGMRFTPLDSAGLYFPGGKASYPSSLIMLAVPAQVAGVKRIAVATPPSKYGTTDLVLATAHELGLTEVYRVGGAAAIAAFAFGTSTIAPVDKIVGPGNAYVQLAKRTVAGAVGVDGYLGPSEILILADDSANPAYIAADLLAQAEHDPGYGYLLTTSKKIASEVLSEIETQSKTLQRQEAITRSFTTGSAIILSNSLDKLIDLANRFAVEHVNLQLSDTPGAMKTLRHAGAIFIGPQSAVAAGDYVAGPSHCLPTNTTARFSSGVSVYEFLKRTSLVQYDTQSLAADARSIQTLAQAEQLDAHAASIQKRTQTK